MAQAQYKGFILKTINNSTDVWQVKIKSQMLTGSFTALKKSIDWWSDTASIVDPKEFEVLDQHSKKLMNTYQDSINGIVIRNESSDPNSWYCFFNGKFIKGSKVALQNHILKSQLKPTTAVAKKK